MSVQHKAPALGCGVHLTLRQPNSQVNVLMCACKEVLNFLNHVLSCAIVCAKRGRMVEELGVLTGAERTHVYVRTCRTYACVCPQAHMVKTCFYNDITLVISWIKGGKVSTHFSWRRAAEAPRTNFCIPSVGRHIGTRPTCANSIEQDAVSEVRIASSRTANSSSTTLATGW